MFARVPASSANLGPGFDALAVALALYLEVTIEPADSLEVTSEGCGAGQFDDERNLAARVATEVLGHSKIKVHVNSEIPVSRGLGSSAALAVAAAAAAGAADALAVAARIDGHAENAGASLLGGLVVAGLDDDGDAVVRPLPLDAAWRFVVVIPDQELSTVDARRALPDEVAFADATRNLSSLGLLIAGLGDHRNFVSSAMDDALHQPYRMGLLEFAHPLLDALRDGGAAASCWSGAGSTMLGLATLESAPGVLDAARGFLAARSLPGTVLLLEADRVGLVVR
jgi:homoserine kinase